MEQPKASLIVVVQLLKRHPYAAIFAVLLLVCGSIDWTSHTISGSPRWERYYGLFQGHFVWGYYTHRDTTYDQVYSPHENELHFPSLGRTLEWGRGSFPSVAGLFEAAVPIWMPLLVTVGWVTWRELKRRKTENS